MTGWPRPPTTLQTVERAFAFLEAVATAPTPVTVRDIAASLGLNLTTCYHLMNTLTALGYLDRADDSTLGVGSRITMLYGSYRRSNTSEAAVRRLLESTTAQTGETSYFSVLVDDRVIIQALVESSYSLRPAGLYIGMSGHEHLRSGGKAVLAFADDETRDRVLDKALAQVDGSDDQRLRTAVIEDLEATRARGWSLDEEASEPGVCAVGAPVYDSRGNVCGAVGLVVPVDRFTKSRESLIKGALNAAESATDLIAHTT